ncbi:MAG: HEAT repeat domain-containing protein [Gemmataceae bacterium]|nr:HEAT repeat domain-containing protein [Gemmataceae bacterium]
MRSMSAGTLSSAAVLGMLLWTLAAEAPPQTGPVTEKRFPPLQVPPGFTATLFACDPLIEYPSVIAAGPKASQLFVAIDYMTGLGVEIVRRDEIRLIEDTDNDGYADKATVVAAGFNSIQGLAYHDGMIYVMHAPFLTALRDPDGDGKFDQRRELLSGLGLEPEKNPPRLHCANGVTVGHDGWLYLALGDHGCNVPRPEGDRLIFNGGGILRCRFDGRDLHVFASGLRNIYDVALDEELNVFTRDNENDGGDYMIRVCHSFFGADHGYPYLYYERPDEAMPPLADLGRGSSAGVVIYLERAFPKTFRGDLFCCEWGRSLVRYPLKREAGGFAQTKEFEFAAGAAKDPYGFKPTDVVVQRDGALMVSDWCDGQRPKRGRGRIYRIAATSPAKSPAPKSGIVGLDSESYWERVDRQIELERRGREVAVEVNNALAKQALGVRGRLHAIWILARVEGAHAIPKLLKVARNDADARVRAQAIRAIADLADPVLRDHRLDAGRGARDLAVQLVSLDSLGSRPLLEKVIALGRLRWADAPGWFQRSGLASPLLHEHALVHAMQQTLRRADNWPEVLKLLDLSDKMTLRTIALRALANQADATIVDGLIERLAKEQSPWRRREYADLLTRVYKKPGPWVYWNYRPAPRTPNSVAWERTEAIGKALEKSLADPDRSLRLAVLRRMQREKIPIPFAALAGWLGEDRDEQRVAEILKQLREHQPTAETVPALGSVVSDAKHAVVNRRTALGMLIVRLEDRREEAMLRFARTLEDGPVLAEALRNVPPRSQGKPVFLAKLGSKHNEVRAAAIFQLGHLEAAELTPHLPKLLADADARVRAAAAQAAGYLQLRSATETLLKLTADPHARVREASLDALHDLAEPRAAPVAAAALKDPSTRLSALHCLAKIGRPEDAKAIADLARNDPSTQVLPLAISALSRLHDRAAGQRSTVEQSIAKLQGSAGVLARWHVRGPLAAAAVEPLLRKWAVRPMEVGQQLPQTEVVLGIGAESAIVAPADPGDPASTWLGVSEIVVPETAAVQFSGACRGPWRVWLDGRLIFENAKSRPFVPDADRFDAKLDRGAHRLVVQVSAAADNKQSGAEFHLRFRRKSSTANHEQLMQAALARPGNADRGRKLFQDVAKSQCLKCHVLNGLGEKIGPDLTGVGNRFARVYLIESILEPNRTIAPSYETLQVQLQNGRVVSGVRMAETPDALTLGDLKGDKHIIPRKDIDAVRPLPVSTMPEGLERGLSSDEFVDLIAFLVNQK